MIIPSVLGVAASRWSPSSLSPNVWVDAADASTFTLDGSLVSEWRDKSGNNRHFSQSGASRPTKTGNDCNYSARLSPSWGGRRVMTA